MLDLTTLLDLYFLLGYMVADLEDLHPAVTPQSMIMAITMTRERRCFEYFFMLLILFFIVLII
jgi:hypothetical protein